MYVSSSLGEILGATRPVAISYDYEAARPGNSEEPPTPETVSIRCVEIAGPAGKTGLVSWLDVTILLSKEQIHNFEQEIKEEIQQLREEDSSQYEKYRDAA